jgi:hypothetical protein
MSTLHNYLDMKITLASPKFWLALGASLIFGLGASTRAAETLSFVITSPQPGQTISGTSVKVEVATNNFSLVDYKTRPKIIPGQGHVHLWMDQENPTKTSAIKIVGNTYLFDNLRPGKHTLTAELVNNDHSSLTPPVISTIQFTTIASPTPTPIVNSSSVFMMSTLSFILLVIALYFVNLQIKTRPSSGKRTQKSVRKTSRKTKEK